MPEENYSLCLINEGLCFGVWGSKNTSSIVFYSDENDVKKLRELINNPEDYNGKISINYGLKEGKILKHSQLEILSAKETRQLVGVDFIARDENLITFYDSDSDLIKEINKE